jgi:hypothetical protein
MASDGRGDDGRFQAGCPPGPGRPKRANELRAVVLDATTEEDVRAVWAKLTSLAKRGQPWSVREFLDRATGRPIHFGAVWMPQEELEGTRRLPSDELDVDVTLMDQSVPRMPPPDREG